MRIRKSVCHSITTGLATGSAHNQNANEKPFIRFIVSHLMFYGLVYMYVNVKYFVIYTFNRARVQSFLLDIFFWFLWYFLDAVRIGFMLRTFFVIAMSATQKSIEMWQTSLWRSLLVFICNIFYVLMRTIVIGPEKHEPWVYYLRQ